MKGLDGNPGQARQIGMEGRHYLVWTAYTRERGIRAASRWGTVDYLGGGGLGWSREPRGGLALRWTAYSETPRGLPEHPVTGYVGYSSIHMDLKKLASTWRWIPGGACSGPSGASM
jgi:hypothetical protein